MAIEVHIQRKLQQGPQAREIMPLILQLRSLATMQTGYISGKTLIEVGKMGELLIISTWDSLPDWERWSQKEERIRIDQKIETITGIKTENKIYESVSSHS